MFLRIVAIFFSHNEPLQITSIYNVLINISYYYICGMLQIQNKIFYKVIKLYFLFKGQHKPNYLCVCLFVKSKRMNRSGRNFFLATHMTAGKFYCLKLKNIAWKIMLTFIIFNNARIYTDKSAKVIYIFWKKDKKCWRVNIFIWCYNF